MKSRTTEPTSPKLNDEATPADARDVYERPAILKRHSVQRVTLFSGAGVASVSSLTGH